MPVVPGSWQLVEGGRGQEILDGVMGDTLKVTLTCSWDHIQYNGVCNYGTLKSMKHGAQSYRLAPESQLCQSPLTTTLAGHTGRTEVIILFLELLLWNSAWQAGMVLFCYLNKLQRRESLKSLTEAILQEALRSVHASLGIISSSCSLGKGRVLQNTGMGGFPVKTCPILLSSADFGMSMNSFFPMQNRHECNSFFSFCLSF